MEQPRNEGWSHMKEEGQEVELTLEYEHKRKSIPIEKVRTQVQLWTCELCAQEDSLALNPFHPNTSIFNPMPQLHAMSHFTILVLYSVQEIISHSSFTGSG